MAEKVLMLALSPTMEEGTIVRWLKKEGETVKNGDILCEVETDKATMDYESIQEGTLLKIVVGEGGAAKVEQPIAIIGKKGEDYSALLAEVEKGSPSKSPAPGAGGAGAATAPATAGGVAASAGGPAVFAAAPASADFGETGNGRVKSSPLARLLAQEAGLDITRVAGSGPGGRVVKRDVEGAKAGFGAGATGARSAGPVAGGASPHSAPIAAPAAAAIPSALKSESVPISGKRKVIAERLSQSMFTAPHYYLRLAVPADAMVKARAALNAKHDRKVSLNAFLIKFAAEAIKRFPAVNSSWQGSTIQMFGSIDIGLAVAQPDGLITPIVRDCGSKGVVQIDAELSALIDKALSGKLKPEEYNGATFTISNLGSFGIDEFTAVINPPGSAILAVGSIKKEPVVGPDDRIEAKTLMRLTLSCDHRVIDGAVGAKFLSTLSDFIEDPVRILF